MTHREAIALIDHPALRGLINPGPVNPTANLTNPNPADPPATFTNPADPPATFTNPRLTNPSDPFSNPDPVNPSATLTNPNPADPTAAFTNTAHPSAASSTHAPASTSPGASRPLHWADLGCGSGAFTLALAHFLPAGSTIHAIDLHPGIPAQTTSSGVHIQPCQADFTTNNLDLANLDGILMANALHYVRDKPALLTSLHSLLRPGASFILVEYDTDTPIARWVPYPLSFAAATHLFTPPHWHPLQQLHTHPSAFGRSNLYSAKTSKDDSNFISNKL